MSADPYLVIFLGTLEPSSRKGTNSEFTLVSEPVLNLTFEPLGIRLLDEFDAGLN